MGFRQGCRESGKARRVLRQRSLCVRRSQTSDREESFPSTKTEERYYCFGEVGEGIMTVRFTYRHEVIRIFGAGYWRKGKRIYEREN